MPTTTTGGPSNGWETAVETATEPTVEEEVTMGPQGAVEAVEPVKKAVKKDDSEAAGEA